ncbi:ATP-dependent helicase [uncultured Robinsoniella sp.]|uniref:ATP-dependent helicase n=1 Tax=Robinsoniella sp. TaxID=2496533 RepID=UPI00374EB18E
MSFTKAQSRAITHKDGPMIVLAGPGSGKTTVITERTKYLIQNYGINPMEILVITFTKAAAQEMRQRFLRLMEQEQTQVTFGTFHAIFFGILKHAYHFTGDNILREDLKHQYLKDIIERMNLDIEDEAEFIGNIISEISLVKNDQIPLEHYYSTTCSENAFRDIYQKYQLRLEKENRLDFDDMLVYTYQLLKERPDILLGWQNRYRYILVDEFQDINKIQYEIVKMLAAPEHNIFIVGDDDQSIYRFRGAKPEIMLNFPKEFRDTKTILLDQNFRCTGNIVKAAELVIRHNQMRFQKNMKEVKESGDKIELHTFANQPQECAHIIKKVQEYIKEDYQYSDIAILFRTNTDARLLVEKFMEYNIPFKMRDSMPNIYDHWIAKNVISYIHLALGSRERREFLQVMNRPNRYIGRECVDEAQVSLENLKKYYDDKHWVVERIEQLEYQLNILKRMTPYAAINFIRHGIGYEAYLNEYADFRKIKVEDLYEVLNEMQEGAKDFKTFEAWFAHIEEYTKALTDQSKEKNKVSNAVTFTTLHSSKGLEFANVFIIDINEGIIPHRKAILDADMQEERRMFYVGMTRAKEHLHMYSIRERYGKNLQPSVFLENLKQDVKTAG